MNRNEKLALFLGMLSGDGCLSIKHNGEGYRIYPIDFCNTEEDKVKLFSDLYYELFEKKGTISSVKRAENRKRIWNFRKYSVEVVTHLKKLGFPEGVKRDILRVLPIIQNGTKEEKIAFIHGMIITDGYTTDKLLRFHLGSKLFLEDIACLISEFIGVLKPVKEYEQGKYKSYQLSLNKSEKELILSQCPDATMVLGRS